MAKCLGRCVMLSISCFQMVLEEYIHTYVLYMQTCIKYLEKEKEIKYMLVLKIGKQRHRCLLCSCFTFFAGLKFLKIQILEKI